jgi:hypothetical protein
MYVTFDAREECRTGNKLIQYLICKVVGHLFGHKYVPALAEESVTVKEEDFERILAERPYYLSFVNIRLAGLFQKSQWLVPYRSALLDLVYAPFNRDCWVTGDGTTVFVKDLVTDVPLCVADDALFMSVRLDDFMHYPWHATSDIPYPSFYIDILRKLSFSKLYIICDKVRYDWEREYLKAFDPWKPTLLQESFEHDCCLMRKCKRLIHSNSTLCWVMSFLSRGEKQRYIPNTKHYRAQCLEAIEEGDTVFYPRTMTHEELGCI